MADKCSDIANRFRTFLEENADLLKQQGGHEEVLRKLFVEMSQLERKNESCVTFNKKLWADAGVLDRKAAEMSKVLEKHEEAIAQLRSVNAALLKGQTEMGNDIRQKGEKIAGLMATLEEYPNASEHAQPVQNADEWQVVLANGDTAGVTKLIPVE